MNISNYIIKKLSAGEKTDSLEVRKKVGYFEVAFSSIINAGLFFLKLYIGMVSGSLAIISDAFHTLSDVAGSIVIWIGIKWSNKKPDKEHPYGHGNVEYVAGIIVAILLVVVGIEFIKSSIERVISPQEITVNAFILGSLLLTILIKEFNARIAYNLGDAIDSTTLKADAWHHRTDALSSIFVIISIILQVYAVPYIDGIAGIIIALFIIYTGYDIAKESISPLLGEAPSKELLSDVKNICSENEVIQGIHDVTIHNYGLLKTLSLHIEMEENISFINAHDIAENLEDELVTKLGFSAATIHADPVTTNFGKHSNLKSDISGIVEKSKTISSYHDLRIAGGKVILVDLVFKDDATQKDIKNDCKNFRAEISNLYPDLGLVLKVEPKFHYCPA